MTPELHRQFIATAGGISPVLQRVFEDIGPVTLPDRRRKGLVPFLARAIVGQQLSTKAARSIWNRVEDTVREHGGRVPDFFCERNIPLLRACGVSGNKIKALCSISTAHAEGSLSPNCLKRMNPEQRSAYLQTIWGIGPWTADMALIFYFREPDIWPEGDITVHKTFSRFVSDAGALSASEAAALFAPHRSLLALYMWRIVERMPS
jgi:DNA-3-methyladenine glycosylase II